MLPLLLPLFHRFKFTVFHPEGAPNDTRLPDLFDGPTLSGKGCFYVHYPNPVITTGLTRFTKRNPGDKPDQFRLCIDNTSPLLRWVSMWDYHYEYIMGWDVDTRHYSNGPHKITVASWLYFQTGEGYQDTIEVRFDNPVTEFTPPPLPPENLNLPALFSA